MKDDPFTTTAGNFTLHPTERTHWVLYTNKNYFDSYGGLPLFLVGFSEFSTYCQYRFMNDKDCILKKNCVSFIYSLYELIVFYAMC